MEIQIVFWALGGLSILALAMADVWRRPDAQSWLLALWVWGTFLFAALVNWTVNGRSLLPLTPAVALLIVRRMEPENAARLRLTTIGLGAAAALSLLVAWADVSFAGAVWNVSAQVAEKYSRTPGALWFQGHWGFQYYMQQFGGAPVDFKSSPLKLGDLVAVPSNNTNLLPPDPGKSVLADTITASGLGWLATMDATTGAGFYSSVWGPLPFAFGRVPPEEARVYQLRLPAFAPAGNPR